MHLIPVTIIAVIGIQSLFLAIFLLRKSNQKKANKFLALLLLFYTLSTLNVALFYLLRVSDLSQLIPFLQMELLFGLGPSIFFYTKVITNPSYTFQRIDFLHFVPVLIELIYYRTSLFRTGSMELISQPFNALNWIFHGIQWTGVLSISIYILLSIRVLFAYKVWVKNNYSNLDLKSLAWLEKPILLYSIFWIVWISIRLIDLGFYQDSLRSIYFFPGFIILSIITCWIGFNGYLKAQTNAAGFSLDDNSKRIITDKEKKYLSGVSDQLKKYMAEEKAYLDPNLSMALFSKKTGIGAGTISKAINSDMDINFHEFVNQYRVSEFKKNIRKDDFSHLNLLGVALESGFNSKSTFNLVFKNLTGKTPRQYVNEQSKKKS